LNLFRRLATFTPVMKNQLRASLLVLSALTLFPAFAHDGHHATIVREATCGSGGVSSKLSASSENGRIEVEYELDDAKPGDVWRILIRKNGSVILRTQRRVNAAGDAAVRVLTPNGNGNERITAQATRVGGGGTCGANLVVNF
jgi:hypothetical protein